MLDNQSDLQSKTQKHFFEKNNIRDKGFQVLFEDPA